MTLVNHSLLDLVKYNCSEAVHNHRMETIGDRLKKARKFAGLNQPELAAMVDMSKAAISNIENGGTKAPTPANLFAIADACRVSPRWLATGVGVMTDKEQGEAQASINAERLFMLIKRLPESKMYEVIDLIDKMTRIEERKIKLSDHTESK